MQPVNIAIRMKEAVEEKQQETPGAALGLSAVPADPVSDDFIKEKAEELYKRVVVQHEKEREKRQKEKEKKEDEKKKQMEKAALAEPKKLLNNYTRGQIIEVLDEIGVTPAVKQEPKDAAMDVDKWSKEKEEQEQRERDLAMDPGNVVAAMQQKPLSPPKNGVGPGKGPGDGTFTKKQMKKWKQQKAKGTKNGEKGGKDGTKGKGKKGKGKGKKGAEKGKGKENGETQGGKKGKKGKGKGKGGKKGKGYGDANAAASGAQRQKWWTYQ